MCRPTSPLHLASASPRRRDILNGLGLEFTFAGVDIDERRKPAETADAMVCRLAREKALAAQDCPVGTIVLAADTAVVLDERVFGKPDDRAAAAAMLESLSGRTHEVLTGVAVSLDGNLQTTMSRTRVRFRDIHPDEAANYWHSGEPADKAGGYAIQGLGSVFVAGIDGSYSGVVGLPIFETAKLLADAGLSILR